MKKSSWRNQIQRNLSAALYGFLTKFREPPDYLADGTLVMGDHSYGNPIVVKYGVDPGKVTIGKYCAIASGVTILLGGNHRVDWVTGYPFRVKFDLPGKYEDGHPVSKGDLVIGSDVWIGYGATILSGITIGHGSVIAAKAVVTKDVPPYAIISGVPARVVQHRFPPEQVEALLKIAWWDWPKEKILASIHLLNNPDIDQFINFASSS